MLMPQELDKHVIGVLIELLLFIYLNKAFDHLIKNEF